MYTVFMSDCEVPGRKIGLGEGYGSDTGPIPTSIRGIAVQGSDEFYVQKLDRNCADSEYEWENGGRKGLKQWDDDWPFTGTGTNDSYS